MWDIKSKKSIKELLEFSIINIDKPTGPTSFSVSQFVKNALGISKTSHLGTLDPQVTGVLPVALNRACRLNEYLIHRDKVYIGIMRLHMDKISEEKLNKEMKKNGNKKTILAFVWVPTGVKEIKHEILENRTFFEVINMFQS